MGAIVKACSLRNSVANTGKECDTSMGATAMLIAIKKTVTFTDTDLLDPIAWLTRLIQARDAFPFFGHEAPINTITNDTEQDSLVTLDDGTKVFLRYGVYNRMFETIAGGLCFAKSLKSLNKSGYNIIEIDQEGQMLVAKSLTEGTYRGLATSFMYAPAPVLADLKSTPYKNRFQLSYSPVEMVENGVIMEGAQDLLSLMGLIDVKLKNVSTAKTTTAIYFAVETECAQTDLVALFPTKIATPTNYILTNVITGAVVVASAGAVFNGQVRLTGTFVTGQSYKVIGSAPSVWSTNLIDGYDASGLDSAVIVVIP